MNNIDISAVLLIVAVVCFVLVAFGVGPAWLLAAGLASFAASHI